MPDCGSVSASASKLGPRNVGQMAAFCAAEQAPFQKKCASSGGSSFLSYGYNVWGAFVGQNPNTGLGVYEGTNPANGQTSEAMVIKPSDMIALGDSKYRLVLHAGGLPGAGWDKSAKTEVEGALDGAKAVFKSADGKVNGTVAGGLLTGTDAAGKAFKLIKVFRQSPTLGAKPPAGAKVLFDGSSADAWQNGKLDDRHFLRCGTKSKDTIQSGTLHIEFFLPFKPLGRGQDRDRKSVV